MQKIIQDKFKKTSSFFFFLSSPFQNFGVTSFYSVLLKECHILQHERKANKKFFTGGFLLSSEGYFFSLVLKLN